MKKIGDIMQEMGFNKSAPDSVKEAFIRHLIKASVGVEVPARPAASPAPETVFVNDDDSQLSFEFGKDESA
jgi:hypothetical protein